MARLTARARKALPKGDFALPAKRQGGKGGYPIEDRGHAKAALARVDEFGTPSQEATVRKKVKAKFPSMHVDGKGHDGHHGHRDGHDGHHDGHKGRDGHDGHDGHKGHDGHRGGHRRGSQRGTVPRGEPHAAHHRAPTTHDEFMQLGHPKGGKGC